MVDGYVHQHQKLRTVQNTPLQITTGVGKRGESDWRMRGRAEKGGKDVIIWTESGGRRGGHLGVPAPRGQPLECPGSIKKHLLPKLADISNSVIFLIFIFLRVFHFRR